MAKKKDIVRYRCINFGVCPKAKPEEVFEFPAIDVIGGTPPCPCCNQNTLEELPPPTNDWWKYVVAGVGALAVLGGGGYGAFHMFGSSSEKDSIPSEGTTARTEITLNHTEKTLFVGESDTLHASVSPSDSKGTLVWEVVGQDAPLEIKDSIVTAKKVGTGNVQVTIKDAKAVCVYTIKEKGNESGPEVTPGGSTEVNPGGSSGGNGPKPTVQPSNKVLGGKAVYDRQAATIYIKGTVTMDLHGADDETVTLHAGDKIVGVKVQNGILRQGEFVIGGERQFFSGLNNKL